VHVSTTRNYGEAASEKVAELLLHLFIAIVVVTIFVMMAMGWRGGLVVFLSVPVFARWNGGSKKLDVESGGGKCC
jgi:multidrug efflux pump subunit AcrB